MNTALLDKRANMGEGLGNKKATKFHLYFFYWENKFIPTTYSISPYSQPRWTLQEEEHKGNLYTTSRRFEAVPVTSLA